jgi:hypothetical protein
LGVQSTPRVGIWLLGTSLLLKHLSLLGLLHLVQLVLLSIVRLRDAVDLRVILLLLLLLKLIELLEQQLSRQSALVLLGGSVAWLGNLLLLRLLLLRHAHLSLATISHVIEHLLLDTLLSHAAQILLKAVKLILTTRGTQLLHELHLVEVGFGDGLLGRHLAHLSLQVVLHRS